MAGSVLDLLPQQTRSVARYIQHPDYKTDIFDYDISILKLVEPLNLNDYVKSVALAKKESHTGRVTVSGWGAAAPPGLVGFPIQQSGDMNLITNKVCQDTLFRVSQ